MMMILAPLQPDDRTHLDCLLRTGTISRSIPSTASSITPATPSRRVPVENGDDLPLYPLHRLLHHPRHPITWTAC